MTTIAFTTAADLLDTWRDELTTGKPPVLYPIAAAGSELARLEVGPGLVTLIGGAPAAGKTAFAMQCVVNALRLTPSLRALVCNVEMPPAVLLDRQLARMSGVDLTTIRYRKIEAAHADRIDQGLHTLADIADRLAFMRAPFDLDKIAAAADDFGASLLLLDYIQRITPPGKHEHDRGRVNRTMDLLRQFADRGMAVIVVSALGRTKDRQGRSSYDGQGLNLASFRESSELEYGADDAFILISDDDDPTGGTVALRHLKSRHGAAADLTLNFDKARQRFKSASLTGGAGSLPTDVAATLNCTAPSVDNAEDHDNG